MGGGLQYLVCCQKLNLTNACICTYLALRSLYVRMSDQPSASHCAIMLCILPKGPKAKGEVRIHTNIIDTKRCFNDPLLRLCHVAILAYCLHRHFLLKTAGGGLLAHLCIGPCKILAVYIYMGRVLVYMYLLNLSP